jgi:uncharacterized protein DUF3443
VFSNVSYTNSYIDNGSSAVFFSSSLYPICTGAGAGFYSPTTMQNLSATLQGTNRATSSVSFSVGNGDQLCGTNPSFMAFSNIATPNPDPAGFAWGLPFFFGRNVFTALEQEHARRTRAVLRLLTMYVMIYSIASRPIVMTSLVTST